ncbi:MAG: prepilin-type N-terminal cleavage/methylation domain-containing protein [Patescibacteria group bacterium]
MNKKSGFTLVELIIVIAVIAILATISIIGLTRYQEDGRDARRNTSVTVIAEALEKYYDQNGEYPSCSELTAAPDVVTGDTGALKGVDKDVFVTPKADSGIDNSITCSDLVSASGDDIFAYVGDASGDCSSNSCLQFTLKYIDEATGTVKTIESRRKAVIGTSGTIQLNGAGVTYTNATVTWNALPNATGYVLERDTVNTFNSGSLRNYPIASTVTSHTSNDLGPSQTVYYRVKATSATGDSVWSNIISRSTTALPAPTLANAQNTPSQVTESWNSISGITSYTLQRSSTAAFSAGTFTNQAVSTTSYSYTDTAVAVTTYYRVRANVTNGIGTVYNSAWSNVITFATTVPPPAAATLDAVMSGTNAVATIGTTTCAYGTVEYRIREAHKANSGAADVWTNWSATWSTTNRTQTVAGLQGNRHLFQGEARCVYMSVGSVSAVSTPDSTVRSINQPATPVLAVDTTTWYDGQGHVMNYTTFCPDGTWVVDDNYTSFAWPGAVEQSYNHSFGYNDWWWLGPSGGASVNYAARYKCASSYAANSPVSSDSNDNIWVRF